MFKRVVSLTLAIIFAIGVGTVAFGREMAVGDIVIPYGAARASYQYMSSVDDGAYVEGSHSLGTDITCDSSTTAVDVVDKIGMSSFVLQRWTGSRWENYKTIGGRYSTNSGSKLVEITTTIATSKTGTYFRWKVTHYVKEGTKVEEFINYSNEVYVNAN